jgi:hypothetical protein
VTVACDGIFSNPNHTRTHIHTNCLPAPVFWFGWLTISLTRRELAPRLWCRPAFSRSAAANTGAKQTLIEFHLLPLSTKEQRKRVRSKRKTQRLCVLRNETYTNVMCLQSSTNLCATMAILSETPFVLPQ